MARPLWFVQMLKQTFPNVSLIAKLTNIPIIGKIVEKMLFEGDDIIYLPKDTVARKTIELSTSLGQPEEAALPSEIVHRLIDQAEFHWIMNFCICRDSSDCKDYPTKMGCLFMGEAAKDINPLLGRPVGKEEAHEYARRCREEGLVHLIGRNKLDAVWLGVGPEEKLLTVCNCCPCCCLWKILPDVNPEIGRKVTKMVGVDVKVTDACAGCGTCTEGVCFVDAITLVDGKSVIGAECRGCGRCVEVCPEGAIELTIEDDRFLEESLARVSAKVDVT
ncbi:MAG: 4Fe-4S binding protein [Candidatus Thorarchaeota archaeon]|nr:MAG: 4Fe-4S binding protein [Candidatus Thorarchaeota archaeon]